MRTIIWDCPVRGCGAGTESLGTDESSRYAVASFRRAHEAEHREERHGHA